MHRDIKPENILLTDGHALVADFGIAKARRARAGRETLTQTGMAVGTPAYMSPEQASPGGRARRPQRHLRLGCVLYEMLAGEPPFTGPTPQAMIARHAADRPAPARRAAGRAARPGAGGERALAKVPADRFQTAASLPGRLPSPR